MKQIENFFGLIRTDSDTDFEMNFYPKLSQNAHFWRSLFHCSITSFSLVESPPPLSLSLSYRI